MAAATPGPWSCAGDARFSVLAQARDGGGPDAVVADIRAEADADLIAHALEDLEALLARISELEDERDNARAWAWSQWHRYFNPAVTDQRHPPGWLDSIDVPAAWTAAERTQS